MAELKILLKIKEPALYHRIESLDLLDVEHETSYPDINGIMVRSFIYSANQRLYTLHCFVSKNYQTRIGDFSNFSNPKNTGRIFGPEYVFGLGINSADRAFIGNDLDQALSTLEQQISGIKKELSHIGILHCDSALLYEGEESELVNRILSMGL